MLTHVHTPPTPESGLSVAQQPQTSSSLAKPESQSFSALCGAGGGGGGGEWGSGGCGDWARTHVVSVFCLNPNPRTEPLLCAGLCAGLFTSLPHLTDTEECPLL